MRKIKLTLFSILFVVLLMPTLISLPFAYSYVAIDWDTQPVISEYSEVCEQGEQKN